MSSLTNGNAAGVEQVPGAAVCRVLVVDDNCDTADTQALLLRSLGHQVQQAYGGVRALELAASWRPHVVLLDLGMPGMSGYEVARQLRAGEGGDELTIVAVTGWGLRADRRRTEEYGFDKHLVKPVSMQALQQALTPCKALQAA